MSMESSRSFNARIPSVKGLLKQQLSKYTRLACHFSWNTKHVGWGLPLRAVHGGVHHALLADFVNVAKRCFSKTHDNNHPE